jgi:hypothetical protein
VVRDEQTEWKGETGRVDGDRCGQGRREMASAIRLDDTDWSKHMMQDSHRMTQPRVSGLGLRIQECMAFMVLISDATHWAHPTGTMHHLWSLTVLEIVFGQISYPVIEPLNRWCVFYMCVCASGSTL